MNSIQIQIKLPKWSDPLGYGNIDKIYLQSVLLFKFFSSLQFCFQSESRIGFHSASICFSKLVTHWGSNVQVIGQIPVELNKNLFWWRLNEFKIAFNTDLMFSKACFSKTFDAQNYARVLVTWIHMSRKARYLKQMWLRIFLIEGVEWNSRSREGNQSKWLQTEGEKKKAKRFLKGNSFSKFCKFREYMSTQMRNVI